MSILLNAISELRDPLPANINELGEIHGDGIPHEAKVESAIGMRNLAAHLCNICPWIRFVNFFENVSVLAHQLANSKHRHSEQVLVFSRSGIGTFIDMVLIDALPNHLCIPDDLLDDKGSRVVGDGLIAPHKAPRPRYRQHPL